MTVIKIKNSSVAGKIPAAGDLQTAELAVNLVDSKLYSKDAAGNIITIGGGVGSGGSGDRPDNPAVGDLFYDTDLEVLVYWTGTEWEELGAGGSTATGDTPPADPENGTLWWNTTDNTLYVYYTDADTSQWVIAIPQGDSHVPDVDNPVQQPGTLDDRYVNKTGDTMTGALVVDEDGIDSEIHIKSAATGGANSKLKFGFDGLAEVSYAEGAQNNYIAFRNTLKEVMRLGQNSTGDVFIPAGGLGIGGYTSPTSTILFNNDGSAYFGSNVGIGTLLPERKLHVAGDWIRVDSGYGLDTGGSTEQVKLDNGYISLTTASSERVRCDSAGNVLIGGTLPDAPNITLAASGSAIFEGSVRSGTGYIVYPASDSDYSFATRNAADNKWSAYITGGGEGTFAGKVEAGEPTNNSVGGVRVSNAGQLRVNYCGADPADTAILIGLHKGTEYGTIFADGSANFKNTHTVTTPTADGQNAYVWLSGVDGANPSASITAGGVISGQNVTFNLEADNPANFTAEGEYTGPTLDVKGSIETATAARAAMRETFQELLVAVQSATDFGELKAAMLVALEDYAV